MTPSILFYFQVCDRTLFEADTSMLSPPMLCSTEMWSLHQLSKNSTLDSPASLCCWNWAEWHSSLIDLLSQGGSVVTPGTYGAETGSGKAKHCSPHITVLSFVSHNHCISSSWRPVGAVLPLDRCHPWVPHGIPSHDHTTSNFMQLKNLPTWSV